MMRLVFCLVLATGLGGSLRAQAPPTTYYGNVAHGLRLDLRDHFGLASTGLAWETRKSITDLLDLAFRPTRDSMGQIIYHPFNHPQSRCFVRSFMKTSLNVMLASMDAQEPEEGRFNVYYMTSSAVIVEAFVPRGGDGVIMPLRYAFDVSDVNFDLTETAPTCINSSHYDELIEQIADRIDAAFVSHGHIDHVSPRLMAAMHARGKTVYIPQDLLAVAGLTGFPTDFLQVATPGITSIHPLVELAAYNGFQLGVSNNDYLLKFDIPIDGTVSNGLVFGQFGDEEDSGIVPFLQGLVASAWMPDNVIVANMPSFDPLIGQTLDPDVRFHTPVWEMTHFWNFGWFGMNLPVDPSAIDPQVACKLVWGEMLRYPDDIQP